jgi:hypothetical protein
MANLMVACDLGGIRICTVSVLDTRGIRHDVEVEAVTLYQAIAVGVQRLLDDSRLVRVQDARVIDVTVRQLRSAPASERLGRPPSLKSRTPRSSPRV